MRYTENRGKYDLRDFVIRDYCRRNCVCACAHISSLCNQCVKIEVASAKSPYYKIPYIIFSSIVNNENPRIELNAKRKVFLLAVLLIYENTFHPSFRVSVLF